MKIDLRDFRFGGACHEDRSASSEGLWPMQAIQQSSNSVSARPLGVLIREEIDLLRGEESTTEQRSEIRRLEAIAVRVRQIDALGERILAAVIAGPTPEPEPVAASQAPQLRGAISETETRLATPVAAKPRQRATRKTEKQLTKA